MKTVEEEIAWSPFKDKKIYLERNEYIMMVVF